MTTLTGNIERFHCIAPELDYKLKVVAFKGTEEVSRPYRFEIDLVTDDGDVDTYAVLGKTALLVVDGADGDTQRRVHGVITRFVHAAVPDAPCIVWARH